MAGSSQASNGTNLGGTSETTSILKRNSKDIAWEYRMLCNPTNPNKVKCKLCGKQFSGGAYRMKEHIAKIPGNVSGCPKSTNDDQEKCRKAIDEAKNKKKNKTISDAELRKCVKITDDYEGDEADTELDELRSNKKPRTLGPMDKFASDINPRPSSSQTRQQTISDALWKERLHKVHQFIGRWIYVSGVPFHATACDEFTMMLEAIGQFCPGVTPPSEYQLQEPLLKEEVERVKGLLKPQEEERKENGCSILMDAWTDRKRRSIMNLCINCRGGTMFLSSKECSDEAHTGQLICEYVKNCIEDVGVENVVQVVTNNARNNMAAGRVLNQKIPNIFWTSCATHTFNLMLESISKLPRFKTIIDRAKGFTIFVYAHHQTLSMMRKFTENKEIVRLGVTRFASCFLTLQSLNDKSGQLQAMFVSPEWRQSKWANHRKGTAAHKAVMIRQFWNGVALCLTVFKPLVKILRLVDGDKKPTMGFLHGELIQAKKDIRVGLNNVEKNIQPIMNIIDERIEGRLDSPLHLAGYLLNPYFLYKDPSIQSQGNVLSSFFKCVSAFFPMTKSRNAKSSTLRLISTRTRKITLDRYGPSKGVKKTKIVPLEWLSTYGASVPNLQRMAKIILSLTTSSSECERNWSCFEGIHTKKRNQLTTTRMNNLVFVQFNTKLMSKRKKLKEKNIDRLASDHATYAQEWLAEGDVGQEESSMGDGEVVAADVMADIRELHDEDFGSDNEEEELLDTGIGLDEDQALDIDGDGENAF